MQIPVPGKFYIDEHDVRRQVMLSDFPTAIEVLAKAAEEPIAAFNDFAKAAEAEVQLPAADVTPPSKPSKRRKS